MRDGFVRVAAGTPTITAADCEANRVEIERVLAEMLSGGARICVLPELCLTGYECRDLFGQSLLAERALHELLVLTRHTAEMDALIFVGLPFEAFGKLYNVAAVLFRGEILGIVPKLNLPTYDEFYERRNFTPGDMTVRTVRIGEKDVPFGASLLFQAEGMPHLTVAAELCEDLWVPRPPSISHALAGATVIANLSASDDLVGKDNYRRQLLRAHSAASICAYLYATAGEGESTTDLVFGAQNMIAENGSLLAEAARFQNETIFADIDTDRLISERRRMTTYPAQLPDGYTVISFSLEKTETPLTRTFDPHPFVPASRTDRDARCDEILSLQALGLKKRLAHTRCRDAVIGLSGGLDSTLALLVTARAFDLLKIPRERILAVTMPCFGTTDRTYQNALSLARDLGATLREIDIRASVLQHFADIGHDPELRDVTYENAQARERTQILMDLANAQNGLVIGTGDLSELALGWATYNGDHMSMYAVNCSVPKTLVRHLVRYWADTCGDERLKSTLLDVLDTPVSPELLPPTADGTIAQCTEDLVGPYELHDFFLYYMLRLGFPPKKILRIALMTFATKQTDGPAEDGDLARGYYDEETIRRWLLTFYRRFFSQQFKRSALPDGPKVGSVSVSPRGNLRMPSDASAAIWLKEIEEL